MEMIQVCMSVPFAGLHAPVKSKCWEAVKLTLIHAWCAGGCPEDISITEHTLLFTVWFAELCHSNPLANESAAPGLITTQWLSGKLMGECSDLLKLQITTCNAAGCGKMSQGSENKQNSIHFIQAFSVESYSCIKEFTKMWWTSAQEKRRFSYSKWAASSVFHLNAALRLSGKRREILSLCFSDNIIRFIIQTSVNMFSQFEIVPSCSVSPCFTASLMCSNRPFYPSLICIYPPWDRPFTNGDVYPINVLFSEKIPQQNNPKSKLLMHFYLLCVNVYKWCSILFF